MESTRAPDSPKHFQSSLLAPRRNIKEDRSITGRTWPIWILNLSGLSHSLRLLLSLYTEIGLNPVALVHLLNRIRKIIQDPFLQKGQISYRLPEVISTYYSFPPVMVRIQQQICRCPEDKKFRNCPVPQRVTTEQEKSNNLNHSFYPVVAQGIEFVLTMQGIEWAWNYTKITHWRLQITKPEEKVEEKEKK